MIEFWAALGQHQFLQNALAAGFLASLACGVVGSYVAAKRITYLAGGIAHCVLAGLGGARYCQVALGWGWCRPIYGALAAALVAAMVMGLVSQWAREKEDTVIGAIWALGMAVGVLFISQTPGYAGDLIDFLFGNILLVSSSELWLMAGLDLVVLIVVVRFHPRFLAVCFDEEFARLRGLRVEALYLLLLSLTAVTVVLLSLVVGIVMVIALFTLPVAVAGRFTSRLPVIMALAVVISMILTSGGLALSYGPDLPTGAVIIVLAGAAYLAALLVRPRRKG